MSNTWNEDALKLSAALSTALTEGGSPPPPPPYVAYIEKLMEHADLLEQAAKHFREEIAVHRTIYASGRSLFEMTPTEQAAQAVARMRAVCALRTDGIVCDELDVALAKLVLGAGEAGARMSPEVRPNTGALTEEEKEALAREGKPEGAISARWFWRNGDWVRSSP